MRIAIVYLEGFLLVMAVYAGTQLAQVRVTPENRAAFQWVAENSSPSSRFLVLTGDAELFCDPVQEWFPALTGRISATTLQGKEWVTDGRFVATMVGLQRMQLCMRTADPAGCIVEEARASDLHFDYLYVARIGSRTRGCREQAAQRNADALLMQLHADGSYTTVYQTEAVEILETAP